MEETRLTLVGRLADDPQLRYTPTGQAVANFRVISTARKLDKNTGKWVDGASVSYRVDCWRKLAENCAETLNKGSLVIVYGVLAERQFESNGQNRYVTELHADHVGPSLLWDPAKIQRAERTSAAGPPDDDPWGSAPPVDQEPDF